MRRLLLRVLASLFAVALMASACGDDGAGSAAEWCDFAREADELGEDLESSGQFRELQEVVDRARAAAPSEIRDDVDTVADFLDDFIDALDENDDNIILAFEAVAPDGDMGDFEAARDRVDAYNESECGIEPDPDDDDELDEQFEGGIIEGLADQLGVSEDAARCLVTELNIQPGEEPDVSEAFDAFEECGVDPFSLAD